ncbi:MAG: insulinase family protein, partial [Melioribacteraceae bacterium]
DYESFTLENGLKVFVVENHKLPRVSFSLIIDNDPILEGENAGYVSLAGELLRTGTTTRTKDQIDAQIDFIAASLSTSASGVYASALTKYKEEILEIMSDVVLNSDFKQEELDKLKKQTMSGLAHQKEDPDAIAGNVYGILLFGKDHPYGEISTEETVESITLEMCNEYYKTYFRPNISYMAVVGDINKIEAEKLIKKYFSSWENKDVPKHEYKIPKAPVVNKVSLVDREESVQSIINIGYPIQLAKGSADVIKVSLLNTILGGSFSSRLNKNLREDKGYTYGAGSSISSDELIGDATISVTVRNEVTDSAVTEILKEMKKIAAEKVPEEELQTTKNYMTGNFARAMESPQTVASFALNTALYN